MLSLESMEAQRAMDGFYYFGQVVGPFNKGIYYNERNIYENRRPRNIDEYVNALAYLGGHINSASRQRNSQTKSTYGQHERTSYRIARRYKIYKTLHY